MKHPKRQSIKISEVIEVISNPETGSGYWGYVIAFPDGSFENIVVDFTRETHDSSYNKVSAEYQKALRKFKIKPDNSFNMPTQTTK